MSITQWLEQNIYRDTAPAELSVLEQLCGRQVGSARFFSSLDDCLGAIVPWTPLYCLPIGEYGGFFVALHLRPSDIASGRMGVLSLNGDDAMIEIANSISHLAFLGIARQEGLVNKEGPNESFDRALISVRDVFGDAFYRPGSFGDFGSEEAEGIAALRFGGTPSYYDTAAFFEDDTQEKLGLLLKGVQAEPRCMTLHIELAQLHAEQGDDHAAAGAVSRSLACYHHTAYGADLDEHYEFGQRLLSTLPELFSAEACRDLTTTDEKDRLSWVMELYQSNDVEAATKLLCDMSYERADYDSVLPIFRKHFEKLGWDWALSLCNLREES